MSIETIKHYLKLVEKTANATTGAITYTTRNGRFQIFVSRCDHDFKYKNDPMNLWHKAGFISKKLKNHICISTEYTDINGNCCNWYNIMIKKSDDGKRFVVNFDYLREWSEENVEELVAECVRMAEMDLRYDYMEA